MRSAAFAAAGVAVDAAVASQTGLAVLGLRFGVRMGLRSGVSDGQDGDYFGGLVEVI